MTASDDPNSRTEYGRRGTCDPYGSVHALRARAVRDSADNPVNLGYILPPQCAGSIPQGTSVGETLDNIFASYVNQGPLEEAAAWMANLTRNHPELAEEFIAALQKGIVAASKGDAAVIKAVNAGGHQVATATEAGEHCLKLLGFYSKLLRK